MYVIVFIFHTNLPDPEKLAKGDALFAVWGLAESKCRKLFASVALVWRSVQ